VSRIYSIRNMRVEPAFIQAYPPLTAPAGQPYAVRPIVAVKLRRLEADVRREVISLVTPLATVGALAAFQTFDP
jgi:hypothetical protein